LATIDDGAAVLDERMTVARKRSAFMVGLSGH
jgi:hypothetical protein